MAAASTDSVTLNLYRDNGIQEAYSEAETIKQGGIKDVTKHTNIRIVVVHICKRVMSHNVLLSPHEAATHAHIYAFRLP